MDGESSLSLPHYPTSAACTGTVQVQWNNEEMRQPPSKVVTPRIWLILSLALNAIFLEISMLPAMETTDSSNVFTSTKTDSPPSTSSTTSAPIIFGHLHYPKTAGTNINGELAAHFERVCGHKGYSFDAHQTQIRHHQYHQPQPSHTSANDSVSRLYPTYHRGRVPLELMWERGFENCDWISLEAPWEQWSKIGSVLLNTHIYSNNTNTHNNNMSIPSRLLPLTLELHVPCRFDSVDHLMSQCYHQEIVFDCSTAATTNTMLQRQVDRCLMGTNRYDDNLQSPPPQELEQRQQKQVQQELQNHWIMKCFDPIPIHPYLDYIGKFLQRKRIETSYQHQFKNNKSRNHTDPTSNENECIWGRPDLQHQVRQLLQRIDYYRFCHKCLGSNSDLLGEKSSRITTDR